MLSICGTSHGPVSVRLSVSVTSRSSTKTAKYRITQTTPHDSPGTVFFWNQISFRNSTGITICGAPNAGGMGQNRQLRQITGYISKTAKNRHIVSIKVEQEVVCALSNGGIAHDLECPLTIQTTPFSAFCTAIHSFATGEPRDFKFGTQTYHSKSHPANEKIFPERGVVRVSWPVLEFYTPRNFSATANARDFKFCTWVGHAKS